MNCRHCGKPLLHSFLDLGFAPPSNAYLTTDDLHQPEKYFPLRIKVCDKCWLVQTEDYARADDLFNFNYAYFSSTSESWLAHAEDYSRKMTQALGLNQKSFVIEVASNDGYLLKNFVALGIPCLGIEPTSQTSDVAEALGIPVLREFFSESLGKDLAKKGKKADLIAGNNVFAHVPDINDFTLGLKAALKPQGTITLEFPHLRNMLEQNQFDTAYHEHFSYLSLFSANRVFEKAGLRIWHVETLTTHGGSLRVFGCHEDDSRKTSEDVINLLADERQYGMQSLDVYMQFQSNADKVKNELLSFLLELRAAGKSIVAYGAAAKGNTLLNYAGIKPDLLPFVCDAAISKQNKFMPGSHIPILSPNAIKEIKPDYVLILPWNIADEVMKKNNFIREWGAKFVIAVPHLKISP